MDEWYNKSMKMLNICIMIDMNNCLSLCFSSFMHFPSLSLSALLLSPLLCFLSVHFTWTKKTSSEREIEIEMRIRFIIISRSCMLLPWLISVSLSIFAIYIIIMINWIGIYVCNAINFRSRCSRGFEKNKNNNFSWQISCGNVYLPSLNFVDKLSGASERKKRDSNPIWQSITRVDTSIKAARAVNLNNCPQFSTQWFAWPRNQQRKTRKIIT